MQKPHLLLRKCYITYLQQCRFPKIFEGRPPDTSPKRERMGMVWTGREGRGGDEVLERIGENRWICAIALVEWTPLLTYYYYAINIMMIVFVGMSVAIVLVLAFSIGLLVLSIGLLLIRRFALPLHDILLYDRQILYQWYTRPNSQDMAGSIPVAYSGWTRI